MLKALQPEHQRLTEHRLLHEKEFRLAVVLSHPNIAATYSYEPVEGIGPCIVQEYIDGDTLADWLKSRPTTAAKRRVMSQLLDALEYLHSLQLVHHDIKADNLLVTRHGQNLKIIDFGLSDTDDSTTPRDNDPRNDIQKFGKLLARLFPHRYRLIRRNCLNGKYSNIAALRRALERRGRIARIMPSALLVATAAVLTTLLYFSYSRQKAQQAEQEQIITQLETTRQELQESRESLDEKSRQIEELTGGIDADEIQAVLSKVYQPVYDSLKLPDAQYQEIARAYATCLPDPIKEYNRLAARYPVGSVQYATFSEAWMGVYRQINEDLYTTINTLPSYAAEYQEGRISTDEMLRLKTLLNGIVDRHRAK